MSTVTEPLDVDKGATKAPRQLREQNRPTSRKNQISVTKILRSKITLIVGIVLASGAALAVASAFIGGGSAGYGELLYHEVKRGDLPITITERGNLESQQNIKILCEMDDIRDDGVYGTPLLWVIENGASVKKGQELAKFDITNHVDRLDEQILDTERSKSAKIQGDAKYTNQITQNETTLAQAKLAIRLAELDLEMFQDKKNGTHVLEVAEIERLMEDVNNKILAAQASLALKRNEKEGIEDLFRLGYAGPSELERSRIELLQAESEYASQMNKLETQRSTAEKKSTYEHDMALLTLEGSLATAIQGLKQVEVENESLLLQARAEKLSSIELYKKEQERLERYRELADLGTITAEQDGMVVYATGSSGRWGSEEIREGSAVRPRQHVFSLPNLAQMQVKTAVHESVVDQVKAGTAATIRVDAFPDRTYTGSVQSVAVLASKGGFSSANTKVYETIVTIDEEVVQLKPGMTAIVEIHVDRLDNVLTAPVQAIEKLGDNIVCWVKSGSRPEKRVIKVGRTNDRFIEIVDGIDEGEQVVLNPMMLMQNQETDDSPSDADSDSSEPTDAKKESPPVEQIQE